VIIVEVFPGISWPMWNRTINKISAPSGVNGCSARHRRWMSYAACTWAVLFAAPHAWWALGIPAAFPGGEANHLLWMTSTWRYTYLVIVIFLSVLAAIIPLALLRPSDKLIMRWIPHTAAWVAGAILTLRGVAGLLVDGTSDPIWWPLFLVGGLLFSAVAWSAHASRSATPKPGSG
jgi:hypothetical protein